MPLGAYRLNSLARYVPVAAGVTLPPNYVIVGSTSTISGYRDTSFTKTLTDDSNFTFSCWFKPTLYSTNAGYFPLVNLRRSDGNAIFMPRVFDDGSFNVYRQWGAGFQSSTILTAGTLSADTWYHIAISADFPNAVTQVYLDGEVVSFGGFNNNDVDFHQVVGIGIGCTAGSTTANGGFGDGITQLWLENSYIDLSANISKFYDNGFVDMGSSGTSSGLSQPLMYHYGNTSTFPTSNGRTAEYTYNILDNDFGTFSDGTN